ncbi:hypothetical protein, partial [Hydrogenophaga palleronii]|uniref:hypothetical protein n=1 Tax=Hydrogenophaga palleronii TaxID=65655 RepID=UPI001C3F1C4A
MGPLTDVWANISADARARSPFDNQLRNRREPEHTGRGFKSRFPDGNFAPKMRKKHDRSFMWAWPAARAPDHDSAKASAYNLQIDVHVNLARQFSKSSGASQ